ncbi:glycosyltransferase family 4 protein [Halorubrum amylolyticum]|uniref:glycosyltransferase family 4 protein n=1 Tax=Halorubrum amylolyticum TaxID=2508724 RepID=UPI001008BCA8|nr:glycosyltransferase family 4 protein [Halorubrum amylolyticum]
MRIVGLARQLGRPGGAEESMRTLFENLAANHQTVVFGHANRKSNRGGTVTRQVFTTDADLPPIVRLPGMYLEFYLRFRHDLKKFRPALIFAQHELALLGTRQDAPQVLFLRDESLLYSDPSKDETRQTARKRAERAAKRRLYEKVIYGSDLLIANSEHTAKKYEQQWDIIPEVVYPFVDVSEFKVESTGNKILHVTPTMNKGIDVTLDVADRLPDKDFLVVGQEPPLSVRERIRNSPNVVYKGYVDDMRDVYRETKLLLMPSRWEEPFGRVPLESGISGIPVLCSGSGGLSEAVGDGDLIVSSNDPAAYVRAIESVLSDYEMYAKRVRRNALAKSAPNQIKKLKNIVKRRLDVEL